MDLLQPEWKQQVDAVGAVIPFNLIALMAWIRVGHVEPDGRCTFYSLLSKSIVIYERVIV